MALDAVEHDSRRPSRLQLHARGAVAAVGLEPRRGEDRLARGDPGQPLALLLVVPVGSEGAAAHHRSSRSAATAPAPGPAPRTRRRPRASTCPTRRPLRQEQAEQAELASCFQKVGGVADRIVLQLAHDVERACSAHTPRTISRSISCSWVKVEIHRRPRVRAASGRRGDPGVVVAVTWQGDDAPCTGSCGRPLATSTSTVHGGPAAPGVVGVDSATVPVRVMCRRGRPSRACGTACDRGDLGAGPVGHVPLEPGALVGGVEEDVAGALPFDGEVVVVVHGPPVARGERAEHDGGGGHVVVEVGQRRRGVASAALR